jgi:hypothetical protein
MSWPILIYLNYISMKKIVVRGIAVSVTLVLGGFFNLIPVSAASGDITSISIRPDGWSADIVISEFRKGGTVNFGLGSANNPSGAKVVFSVTSPGFDQEGNPTTLTRPVYGTAVVRLPYPDDSQLDEKEADGSLTIRVALSDFVYAGDSAVTATIAHGWYVDNGVDGSGASSNAAIVAVTNTSTLQYPKAIGRWAWPGYERLTGDLLAEAVVFNRFARNGNPVAAVRFDARDEHGNSVSQTIREMSVSTRSGEVNPVLVYAATLPTAALQSGDQITVHFRAYPWIGNSSSILDTDLAADGVGQPSEQLGPLYEMFDRDGSYGGGYAFVSADGDDATGVVADSQAVAEAGSAFKTITAAARALAAYHQEHNARTDAGGGVILLASGEYSFPGIASTDLGDMKTWLTIRPASAASRETTVIVGNSGSFESLKASKVKIEDVTFSSTGVAVLVGNPASDIFWLHHDAISMTGMESIGLCHVGYATDNHLLTLNPGFTHFSTDKCPWALVRGNTADTMILAHMYAVLGNKNILPIFVEEGNPQGQSVSDNSIFAYNTVYGSSGNPIEIALASSVLRGIAIVSNLIEQVDALQPLLRLADSSSLVPVNNVLLWHNTFAGQRENLGYNDNGSMAVPRLNWSQKFNIFQSWNHKDDTFLPPDGHRVGGWPILYNVGALGNVYRSSSFRGAFDGLAYIFGGDPAYGTDASAVGTGTGNGDYRLTSGSAAINILAGAASDAILPFDLAGQPRIGLPDAGAYEFQGSATAGSGDSGGTTTEPTPAPTSTPPITSTSTPPTSTTTPATTTPATTTPSTTTPATTPPSTTTPATTTTPTATDVQTGLPLGAPALFMAERTTANFIELDWVGPNGGRRFIVENVTTGIRNEVSDSEFTAKNLSCGTTYSFRVKAVDALDREGPFSDLLSVPTTACAVGSSGGGGWSWAPGQTPAAPVVPEPPAAVALALPSISTTGIPAVTQLAPIVALNKTFKARSVDPQVKVLQMALNRLGFTVASTGPGSAGNETAVFGPLTQQAVMKFQNTYAEEILKPRGLNKPTGVFGASSLSVLQRLLRQFGL